MTAQMAAHRGFSAISRLYQYQLRPSKVVSFTPDVTKPAKYPFESLLGYERGRTRSAVIYGRLADRSRARGVEVK